MQSGLYMIMIDKVASHWPLIEPHVKATLAEHNTTDILEKLLSGEYQLWMWLNLEDNQIDTVVITNLMRDNVTGAKVLNISLMSSNMLDNIPVTNMVSGYDSIERFARGEGCATISTYGNDFRFQALYEKLGFTKFLLYAEHDLTIDKQEDIQHG